jgi:methionyl-tRNA synthetase
MKEKKEKLALQTKILIFSGHKIENTGLLFEKIEDEQVAFQLSKLKKEEPKVQSITSEPIKPVTDFDLFSKMDLRTARIISAEKVEGTDKLLKITLDLGFEQRTVVSGIAKHFSPEQLPGTMVTLLANLAPRRIKGIESNGMILMAEDSEGRLFFVNSESASGLGSVIK